MTDFDRDHFDALYAADPDPWRFRTSRYERRKYRHTLEALPRPHYARLLELGCANGELTRLLARRADRVTAVDVSPIALAEATKACAALTNVRFVEAMLPEGAWNDRYDAIVLSEILYYLQPDALDSLATRIVAMAPAADMVLVHWTGETNYPLSGDAAAERFLQHVSGASRAAHARTAQYRLDVVRREAAMSSTTD